MNWVSDQPHIIILFSIVCIWILLLLFNLLKYFLLYLLWRGICALQLSLKYTQIRVKAKNSFKPPLYALCMNSNFYILRKLQLFFVLHTANWDLCLATIVASHHYHFVRPQIRMCGMNAFIKNPLFCKLNS